MSMAFGARDRMLAGAGRHVPQSGRLLCRVLCICTSRLGRRHRTATGGLSKRLGDGRDRSTYMVGWFTCVLGCAVTIARAVKHWGGTD